MYRQGDGRWEQGFTTSSVVVESTLFWAFRGLDIGSGIVCAIYNTHEFLFLNA